MKRAVWRSTTLALVVLLSLAACGTGSPSLPRSSVGARRPGFDATTTTVPTRPAQKGGNVYAAVASTALAPVVAHIPARVYVPNTGSNTVDVIDPATFQVVGHFPVGTTPHHIAPSWDMTKLYVDNTAGNSLTVINPVTTKPERTIPVIDPYNLYFTPDGTKAIVVAERFRRLDFRDPVTWALIKSVPVPWSGIDHLDFSADGRYLMATTEFSGMVVKVDTEAMAVVGTVDVGGLPIDVKLSPDGSVFYVTNQGRHGVSIVDPNAMREVAFIATGQGAHGLVVGRDGRSLYVSNRLGGSVTLIDTGTHAVLGTSKIGGSPDMMQVSPDGSQLWVSNRFNGSVSVLDAHNGQLLHTIKTGKGPHGLTFFPQPGRFSIGHNGVYR